MVFTVYILRHFNSDGGAGIGSTLFILLRFNGKGFGEYQVDYNAHIVVWN